MAVSLAVGLAQERQAEDQLPRFRAGANLVRVDTYISLNGVAVTDLTPDEIQIFEDDTPQKIENLELIEARGPA
ncbi:MAG: hypothetical protein Q8N52_07660, partial [Acidobacteriota bacterium]|nr:hypothetical protein [Acidobacteriota bacterium]